MKKTRSIKWILISSFILAVAIPLGFTAFFLVRSAADTLKDEIILSNRQLSISLNKQLSNYLSHTVVTLTKLGKTLDQDLIPNERVGQELNNIVSVSKIIFKIQISNKKGFVKHIAPYDNDYINIDVSNLKLFKVPEETGTLYWSPTFISLQFNRPVVTLSIPFKKGVITGFISLGEITDRVRSQIGKSFIAITDQTGTFIEHPDKNKILQRAFDPNYKSLSKNNTDVRIQNLEINKRKMMVFAGVIQQTKWLVTVYESYEKMFRPVRRLYILSVINLFVIILFITLISLRHVRKIMGEINTFKKSSGIISDGKYNERIQGTRFKEFRELASQFNKMAASIEEREISIKENEKRLRHILDYVGVGIFLVDPETYCVTYVNPEALKILQKDKKDVVGSKCIDIVCNIDQSNCPANVGIGKTNVHEREVLTGNGEKIPILKTSTMTRFADNNIIIESFVDLRNIKAAEKEKQKLEQQLLQVQKLETIGTLAGGIAHDFNNILSPILGYAEIAQSEVNEGEPMKIYLEEIFNASVRAKELVKQILTFSRQSKHELNPIKIAPIVKEVLKLVRATIPSSIEIKKTIPNLDCAVKADPTQIHQIIMNLVTNAFHAMEKDGGTLTVNLKEIDLGMDDLPDSSMSMGKYVYISVSDTGTGMDRATLSRIFEPYFSTKETGKGTGLGLSVVHGIIKEYGGNITVYSEPSLGTTFKVLMPVFKLSSDAKRKETGIDIPKGDERILFVDDDPNVLAMIRKILENLGYRVTARLQSIAALEDFRWNPDKYDLVITDMTMPKMNGLKFSEEIMKTRPDIPVIICSGFSEQLTEENIKRTGIKAVVMKPVITSEIANTVREVLDSRN